jgi:hypothetical protein
MAKYRKKKLYADGGNISYNGNPVSDSDKDMPKTNNAAQYAGYGAAALNAYGAYSQAQNNPNLTSNQKTTQGLTGAANSAGAVLPWLGAAQSAAGMGKSFIPKDEYGNAKSDVGQAANEIITPDHQQMINDIGNKNYTALALDSTGLGKFARMGIELSGNADKTTGFLGKANKALGTLQTEKANAAQQDKLAEEQMLAQQAAEQQQQDYIAQQVQSQLKAQGAQGSQYAMGGQMQHGKKMCADGGDLTEYQGNSHEMGGIDIGGVAEVEQGETRGIENTETQDYIYSDRLKVPGKKYTFAKASKFIESKYSKRDNDPMSAEQKERDLTALMNDQESVRQKMITSVYKRAFGGELSKELGTNQLNSISANTSNYPVYQSINGTPVKGYVNVTPDQFKNVDKSGANMIGLQNSQIIPQTELDANKATGNYFGEYKGANVNLNAVGANDFRTTKDGAGNTYYWKGTTPITQSEYKPKFANGGKVKNYEEEVKAINDQYAGGQYDVANRNSNSGINNIDYNSLYNVGNFLGAGYDIYRGLKGGDKVNYERINPDLVNYQASRNQLTKDINAGYENTRGNIRSVVNNPAQYLNLITQVAANRDQQLGESITKSQEAEANTNAQIRNQAKAANAQTQRMEADTRQQERDIASNTLQNGLSSLGNAIANTGRDKQLKISQQESKKFIGSTDYSPIFDKKGNISGYKHKVSGQIYNIKD